MSKLKSLKEFEIERSSLKNITGGLMAGKMDHHTIILLIKYDGRKC